MKFVKRQDFSMYHDLTDGVHAGWVIKFTIHYTANRGTQALVSAHSPTGRVIRSPQQVSRIMPVEDWPEFARKALSHKAEGNTDERLF
jgi:hypothetical protein